MITQHIHYSYLRNSYTEQVGTLCHTGSYQQTTIGTAYYGNLIFISIFIIDKIFGSRNKIIKYILLLHLGTCYVPVFTILATPTQVNLCIDTSIFQERNT